jgi:hypothetical protein
VAFLNPVLPLAIKKQSCSVSNNKHTSKHNIDFGSTGEKYFIQALLGELEKNNCNNNLFHLKNKIYPEDTILLKK